MVDRLACDAPIGRCPDIFIRIEIAVPAGEVAGCNLDSDAMPGLDDDAGRPEVDFDLLDATRRGPNPSDTLDKVQRPPVLIDIADPHNPVG